MGSPKHTFDVTGKLSLDDAGGGARRRACYQLETLEPRLLLSADVFGIPDWDPEGPAPTTDGQVSANPNDQVVGAVEALAAHPTDADILYAGGVDGGIWRTDNATAGAPNWLPQTDQHSTLAISDLAFSPLDPTNETLYAATGGFTNGGQNGPAQGIMRTTDGGDTWLEFGQFGGSRMRSIVPTSIGTSVADQVVLTAVIDAAGGVYRSTDGGETFTQISGTDGSSDGLDNDADGTVDEGGELNLPNGAASYLTADPGNPNRFYAALANQGVFRSDDGGQSWIQMNNGLTGIGASNNIELAVSEAAPNTIYAGFISGGALANVFWSTDAGANWNQLGVAPAITPGNQGFNDFSIGADPVNENLVYVGGDRQAASPFFGNMFRGDRTTGVWTDITTSPIVFGTAPHADSRDIVFDVNNDMIEADDGGVFRLTDPRDGLLTGGWTNLNSNLQVGQFYSTTYDNIDNVIFGGTQDTGSAIQTGGLTWDTVNQGDGGDSGVAYGDVGLGFTSVRYTIGNNLANGSFQRAYSDGATDLLLGGTLALNGIPAGDQGSGSFITFAYEPNTIDFTRLVVGGQAGVYESSDFGDNFNTITPAGATGRALAFAYGGTQDGTDNADVLYVGQGGNLYLRTTSGGALNQVGGYTGGTPRDIVLHPDDWARVYVSDGNTVWFTEDATAATPTWTAIGDTSFLTGNLLSLELYSPTNTPGDEVILAGGAFGVLRTLNPGAGNDADWLEFGSGLPNAPVADMMYDPADDFLVASAFGRGVWSVADASDFLTVEPVVLINGDELFDGQDDVITLIRDMETPSILNVFLNDPLTPELSVPLAAIQYIDVNGHDGDDTLNVDSTYGLIYVPGGIRYDGGTGSDLLQLLQEGGTTQDSDTYAVGPSIGSGTSIIAGPEAAATVSQVVRFERVDPVIDLVPAVDFAVVASGAGNAISYTAGSVAGRGLVVIDEHESIEFANKTNLALNAEGGADVVSISNPSTPAGLLSVAVDGGDPSAGDSLIVTGANTDVVVNALTRTIEGATGGLGSIPITWNGIEHLGLFASIDDLTFVMTSADDTVTVTPGADSVLGANTGSIVTTGAVPAIDFVNAGTLILDLGLGNDELIVHATTAAETIAVSGSVVAIAGRRSVEHTNTELVRVNGDGGADTFDVTPSLSTAFFIDGGPPVGLEPGDALQINANGSPVVLAAGPESDEGGIAVGGNDPISFDRIETIAIDNAGPVEVNGTNGPDAITVIARDASTHAGADGIEDFTVSVNAGAEILFIDAPSIAINALGGSDEITVRAPAPNEAVWDVDVSIDGGTPGSDVDRVIVETPGAVMASYTPTAFDSGLLALTTLSSNIAVTAVELLDYSGQGDADALSVIGTGGGDTFVHMPGANDASGTIAVNVLLAIGYQNLGAAASLAVDGVGGQDELVMNGTPADDTFSVDAGVITQDGRVPVATSNIETLTLEGFEGDDFFVLVPAISASAFTTINFNGGSEASAAGDRVSLVGTVGDDDIVFGGSTVNLGAVTVNANGIENIGLDALGGDDLLVYNGVAGVSEDILVSSSGVVGGGQISVPGVVLVNFLGVERIDVNGNAAPPSDTDTLTFAGTNADDTFEINLAADGTDADPIVALQDNGGTTLLTLRNYTNFETLGVKGLDGEDVFNVATDSSGPSRDLFVDGGSPTGKKKSTDELNITYEMPRPRIVKSAAIQNQDEGIVDLDYDPARFIVKYVDIENVTIRKA